MKKLFYGLALLGLLLSGTSCTVSAKKKALNAHKQDSKNGWAEKSHHYRSLASERYQFRY
ncbi:MAG: hypothetical protein HN509_08510 [Halobacteriovoraceae bacterium]|jgi:hypothetical protein|nr:hypothetical protein [Halobacteriovoraceae bacterium]MBT5095291.1 hypothetical protein [Halobacteriovoraceae bacterium]